MLPVLPAKRRVRAGPRGSGPGAKRRRPCPPLRAAAAGGRRDKGRPDPSTPGLRPGPNKGLTGKQARRGRRLLARHEPATLRAETKRFLPCRRNVAVRQPAPARLFLSVRAWCASDCWAVARRTPPAPIRRGRGGTSSLAGLPQRTEREPDRTAPPSRPRQPSIAVKPYRRPLMAVQGSRVLSPPAKAGTGLSGLPGGFPDCQGIPPCFRAACRRHAGLSRWAKRWNWRAGAAFLLLIPGR